MRALLLLASVLVVLFPATGECCTVTLGDDEAVTGDNIATMLWLFGETMGLGSDWTLCIAPGTYDVSPDLGWPVLLTQYTPEIVGTGGASVTVLQGDGSTSAFVVQDDIQVNVRMSGLTFRHLDEPIDRGMNYPVYLEFTDNVIEGCQNGLNASEISGEPIVARNLICDNSGWGIRAGHNDGTIEHNEICGNAGGITWYCCDPPAIEWNHIHHNSGTGLSSGFYLDASWNIIEFNGGVGLSSPYVSGTASWNIIRNNDVGVLMGEMNSLSMECNDIYNNVTHQLEVSSYSGGYTGDATMTWWGTTDPAAIAAGIWDCADDPGIQGCVAFDPWADGPGCGQTPVEATSWGLIKSLYR